MEQPALHHVTIPVTDLERSRRFYSGVIGLREIERPPFDFPGAWFEAGGGQLHLIERADGTFRARGLDSRDAHFGVRVPDFEAAVESLRALGYSEDADGPLRIEVGRRPTAGFPQIYVLDPDRHVVEINAARLS